MKVLLVGGGAREHAIGTALCRNSSVELLVVAQNRNPGLESLAVECAQHTERDVRWIVTWAQQRGINLAVIGLEDPLDVGLPDALESVGIPTVGPLRTGACLETSKLFTRELMERHDLPGRVEYRYFTDAHAMEEFLRTAGREFALKPIGLTAGKGVKVMGVQLATINEAMAYGRSIINDRIGGEAGVLIEERLEGQEFTLQAFVDAHTILPMPLVKDYKRAFEGDEGPNTGSMGAYSQPDGLLPFVDRSTRDEALNILKEVVDALKAEGHVYRGIMYGQFMMTPRGLRLVEINARFGDPEAINVLQLLETDFADVCRAIVSDHLQGIELRFSPKATVCKYITPPGYGEQPRTGVSLQLDQKRIEALGVHVYFAKVAEANGAYLTTTSRAIALLGVANSIDEAEQAVERALAYVSGEYHIRHDIGTRRLIAQSLDTNLTLARRFD